MQRRDYELFKPTAWSLTMRLALSLLAVLALAACAETKYRSDAMPPMAANQARIIFFRNGSFVGANMQTGIVYDGSVVGNSRSGTYFYIDTTPGTHDISTTNDVNSHLNFALAPGETAYVKTGVGLGQFAGRIEPEQVGANRAMRELPELSFAPSGPTFVAGKPAEMQNAPVMEALPASPSEPAPAPLPALAPAPVPAVPVTPVPHDSDKQTRLGESSNSVEELALRAKQCEAVHGAALVSADGPIEYYREQCRDGRVFRAKCQFRQCVEIDSD
jgi:Protein of unknown function (DUF2846)